MLIPEPMNLVSLYRNDFIIIHIRAVPFSSRERCPLHILRYSKVQFRMQHFCVNSTRYVSRLFIMHALRSRRKHHRVSS
jgi:hypothetical protein